MTFTIKDVINIDQEILGGTPVFSGTRIPISILFDYLEDNRMSDFLENYPTVAREQVTEVIKLASEMLSQKALQESNI